MFAQIQFIFSNKDLHIIKEIMINLKKPEMNEINNK